MAGTMSVSGIVSGLSTDDIISKIMAFAKRPQDKLKADLTEAQNRLAAWQDINTRVLALKVKSEAVADAADFGLMKATSSDESIVTVSASGVASPGSYYLKVTQRAQAHQISSATGVPPTYTSANDVVGTGTVTIELNSGSSFGVTLTTNNNTLAGLRDAINNAHKGVKASIINAGTSASPDYRMLLTSESTGEAAGINSVDVGLTGGTAPSFEASLASPVQAALDAELEIGGGTGGTAIQITKADNLIADVIPGVTLNILSADSGKTIRVDVTRDTTAVKKAVQDFVSQYNGLVSSMKSLTGYDTETGDSGLLMGDFQLQSVQMEVESAVTGVVAGVSNHFCALSTIGISLDTSGQLSVNDQELTAAIENNITDVVKLFDSNLDTQSSYISYISSSPDTKVSGTSGYMVNVTQAARRSQITAGAAMTENLDVDENLVVNGTTIALTSGMTLNEVISTINSYSGTTGVTALKTDVSGTGEGSYLTLRRAQYGSAYTLSAMSSQPRSAGHTTGWGDALLTPSSPGDGLGLAGLDVAGTINGETASGVGQVLSLNATTSTNDAKGLSLLITATAPMDPVAVNFTKGVGARVRDLLGNMTSTGGAIMDAQAGVNSQIDSLDKSIASMDELLASQESRLYAQFSAMEEQLSKLKSQGDYIASQLAAMNSSD